MLAAPPAAPGAAPSLAAVLRADVRVRYPEAAGWSAGRIRRAFAVDPSLQTVLALRLALHAPHALLFAWRTAFIAWRSVEIAPVEIGPGLHLPHPVAIAFGPGVVFGGQVTIYEGASIGYARTARAGETLGSPTIGDGVTIGPWAMLAGEISIGAGSTIGPKAFVTRDVPAGATVTAGAEP